MPIADEVGRLFKSSGPLEVLAFSECDMGPYFASSVLFPPTKELIVTYLSSRPRDGFEAAIVRLAESQHVLGVPFKWVTLDMYDICAEMEKGLRLWAVWS